jgi:hypothetical protein
MDKENILGPLLFLNCFKTFCCVTENLNWNLEKKKSKNVFLIHKQKIKSLMHKYACIFNNNRFITIHQCLSTCCTFHLAGIKFVLNWSNWFMFSTNQYLVMLLQINVTKISFVFIAGQKLT